MKLSQAARWLSATLKGADADIKGVSIDTRTLQPGNVFFALSGPNFDGHDFIEKAQKAGAICVVVSHAVNTSLATILVSDVHEALVELATRYREQLKADIIAVTGSCGKTTTRSLLENIFSHAGKTAASEKSYNNDIGVPLTLLKIPKDCQYVVSEMGANHPGEIAKLTHMVKPQVAIITNAASAHLEGFGSLQGVACAKGEIYQGLSTDGVAVINDDDSFAGFWKKLVGSRRTLTFSMEHEADITAVDVQLNEMAQPSFILRTSDDDISVQMQLIGEHNVRNALAAAAAGVALGVSLKHIKAGLETDCAVYRRLNERKGKNNSVVIDDSYNANPSSVTAAIQVLAKRSGKSILVFGDMLELGELSADLHDGLGSTAHDLGVDALYCYGHFTRHTAEAFGKNGFYFESQQDLINELAAQLHEGVTVLVKGSLGMNMDRIVAAIVEE